MAKKLIGLDIGATAVRAVEIDHSGVVPSLIRLGQVRLPAGVCAEGQIIDMQIVADAIRQLWEQQAFSSPNAAVGVASQQVITRPLSLPGVTVDQIRSNLAVHARDSLPMSPDEAYLEYQHVATEYRGDSTVLSGLMVAVARDYVDQVTRVVEMAGLVPAAVDLDGFALTRAFTAGLKQLDTTIIAEQDQDSLLGVNGIKYPGHVLLHIGATLTLMVVVSGGMPQFVRIIMLGGQQITEALASLSNITLEQAERLKMERTDPRGQLGRVIEANLQTFCDEVQNSITFYRNSGNAIPLYDIVLSGGGALMIGLGDMLSRQAQLPVMYGSALSLLNTSHVLADQATLTAADPFLPIAVGLTNAPVK